MKLFYYKKMINGIQYSNVCLEISPIYEYNQESDPWDINYYPNDDPEQKPLLQWRSHGNILYSNWLNYYVYQNTPYEWNKISEK